MSLFGPWPYDPKFIKKRDDGVVLYTKPKDGFIKSFKSKIVNRRLQTKRVETRTRK